MEKGDASKLMLTMLVCIRKLLAVEIVKNDYDIEWYIHDFKGEHYAPPAPPSPPLFLLNTLIILKRGYRVTRLSTGFTVGSFCSLFSAFSENKAYAYEVSFLLKLLEVR